MNVSTAALVSITEANRNFSRVARLVDETGPVVILKNNKPRYVLVEFEDMQALETAADEDVRAVSERLLARNREAYEILSR